MNKFHFTLYNKTTGEITEQDRWDHSFGEFIADRMEYGDLEPEDIKSIERTVGDDTYRVESDQEILDVLEETCEILEWRTMHMSNCYHALNKYLRKHA